MRSVLDYDFASSALASSPSSPVGVAPATASAGAFASAEASSTVSATSEFSVGAAFVKPIHCLINLVDHLFADARNLHQLFRRHSRKLLDGSNPRRFNLLDGLRAHSRQRRQRRRRSSQRGHLLFNFLALFFFALDVNVPANQLARQPNVL